MIFLTGFLVQLLLTQDEKQPAYVDIITDAVKLIFSWIVLMPIAVIVSGKLLAQVLKIPRQQKQLFQIKIPGVLTVRAQNDEVVIGFALFLCTFFITALIAGRGVYQLFVDRFGIDLGQFTSLCVFCSFQAVLFSSLTLVGTRVLSKYRQATDSIVKERDAIVESIARQAKETTRDDKR